MFRSKVYITLRDNILDPQGKAILEALHNLDFTDVSDVRVGKLIKFDIKEEDKTNAENKTKEICNKLLHNPIIENYSYELFKINT